MKADSAGSDFKLGGNGSVAASFHQQLEYFGFVRGEVIVGFLVRSNLAEQFDYPARDFRRHRRASGYYTLEAFDKLCGLGLLQQIAGGPRAQSLEDTLVVVVNRKRKNQDRWMAIL